MNRTKNAHARIRPPAETGLISPYPAVVMLFSTERRCSMRVARQSRGWPSWCNITHEDPQSRTTMAQ